MHNHVYVDESGEFGVGVGSSKFLVVTALYTDTPRAVEKVAKKAWNAYPKLHVHGELHANEAGGSIVLRTLKDLMKTDVTCVVYVLKKSAPMDVHKVYYEMLAQVIRDSQNAFEVYIDKRDTVKKRGSMINDIPDKRIFHRVHFVDSRASRQVQMADFVSWAVFQSLEHQDDTYLKSIQDKVILHEWMHKTK